MIIRFYEAVHFLNHLNELTLITNFSLKKENDQFMQFVDVRIKRTCDGPQSIDHKRRDE